MIFYEDIFKALGEQKIRYVHGRFLQYPYLFQATSDTIKTESSKATGFKGHLGT